ncbi:MAG: hypothetical protein PHE09_12530 [Oscillospiraceae bacterium]|nr:hypothetical protein [Oscillospiraceae bacterium]
MEQAVHDVLWKALDGDLDVYESRPVTEVGYPFADFGDFDSGFFGTKSGLLTQVSVTVNFWDTEENRLRVSDLAHGFLWKALGVHQAYGHEVTLRAEQSSVVLSLDRSVTPPVWRGMVVLVFSV